MGRGYGFPTSASDGALPSAAMVALAPSESFWKPGGWWDGGKKKRCEWSGWAPSRMCREDTCYLKSRRAEEEDTWCATDRVISAGLKKWRPNIVSGHRRFGA